MFKHLLTIADLAAHEIVQILDHAEKIKRLTKNGQDYQPLKGKTLAMVFEKASTRTRVSFEVGMYQLGGHALVISKGDSQLGRGEPISDTARVLSRYCDGIMIRTFSHETAQTLALNSSVPVINGLTDLTHPCQVLSDLLTIREYLGDLANLKIVWIGDGNNMANSWINAAAVLGLELVLACPEGFHPDGEILARAGKLENGSRIKVISDPLAAVEGAHVINTDVWASMGQEAEAEGRLFSFKGYQVNEHLLSKADKDAIVLHCLPAHRGEEISEAIIDGPNSAIWDQAENRLHLQKSILDILLNEMME